MPIPAPVRHVLVAASFVGAALFVVFIGFALIGVASFIGSKSTGLLAGFITTLLVPVFIAAAYIAIYYLLGRRGRAVIQRYLACDAEKPAPLSEWIRRVLVSGQVTPTHFRAIIVGSVLVTHADGVTVCRRLSTGDVIDDLDVPPAALLFVTAPLTVPAEPAAAQG